MTTRIADRGVETKSGALAGRHLGVGICGGIGAVEIVKIIRELRRHGARISTYFTPSVTDFITPLSVEWAAGGKVIQQLGADVDHLDPHDLVVVAPLTLNTLSKTALGLADNAVTLLIASQLGRKAPLLLVPTMNLQLRQHPLYETYRDRVKSWGAQFLEPKPEEDRMKMPSPAEVVDAAVRILK